MTPKKQAAQPEVRPQPVPATTTTTPAIAQPATPSKQEVTLARLKEAWAERKVDLSKMTTTMDGKFMLVVVAEGWPIIRIGASGGIELPQVKSYAKAFDAATDGLAVYQKQLQREAKKVATAAAPAKPAPAQPGQPKETPAAKKAKQHQEIEQRMQA